MRHALRGFTIIELVVVMTLIGLIVAIAAPRVDVAQFRVNAAMQVVGTTILTAQRQAVTQQHNVIVYFDTANRRLQVHEDRDNDAVKDATEHVRSVPIGEGIVFGRGAAPALPMGSGPVVITRVIGGIQALVFHRDGSASEVGGFYVTSDRAQRDNNRPQDARAVRVERATGRASWFRYRGSAWIKVF